jgi:hypothetical protein
MGYKASSFGGGSASGVDVVSAATGVNVAVGDLIVCLAAHHASATAVFTSVGDTLGNTGWTFLTGIDTWFTSSRYELWYCIATAAGACTVSAHQAFARVTLGIAVAIYDNVSAINGAGAAAGANTGTAADSGNLTPASGDLCIGMLGTGVNAANITAGSGYTLRGTQTTGTYTASIEDRFAPDTTPLSATFGVDASTSWGALMALFTVSGGAPAVIPTELIQQVRYVPMVRGGV